MTTTQGDLAALSQYVFRAPRWYSSLAFALLIAAAAGIAAFDSRFVLEDAWQGVFFIGVPTVVASLAMAGIDRRLGGQLTANRASLLALSGELVIVAALTVAGVVTVLTPLDQKFVFDALLAGLAAVFAFQLLVVIAVSRRSLFVAAIPAGVQTATTAVLLYVYSGAIRSIEAGGPITRWLLSRPQEAPPGLRAIPVDFSLLVALCVFYALAVWVFLSVIDRPWRRSLDVSVLDFIAGFVGHIAEGTRELEDVFEAIGEEALIPVTVCSFRRFDGSEKARFVLAMVHPGPMGQIGGGNLPERVAENAEGLAFPPHATAGHDFNLVTEREVDTILDSAASAATDIEYDERATPAARARSGEATVLGQRFGEDVLLVSTYAPDFADDVDYGVGLAAIGEARANGAGTVMLVDAHNSNDGLDSGALGHVVPGSERSFALIDAAGAVTDGLGNAREDALEMGVAWDRTPWTPAEGIGPLGVRVAVLESGGERSAYVLVDGNNMEPGLRDRIVSRLEGNPSTADSPAPDMPTAGSPAADSSAAGRTRAARHADAPGAAETAEAAGAAGTATTSASHDPSTDGGRRASKRASEIGAGTIDVAEVMTTDTHIVNTVESVNQVGAALPADELIELIEELVEQATRDLEPVEVGMESENARVTVFGNDRTETLASHANAMIAMGGALAIAVIAAVMAISVLVFFLAGV
jgi:putative membrane protein